MAERHRAAVHIDAVLVDLEQPDRVERDRAERLVHLEQVDVGDGQARLLERDPRRRRGRSHEVGVVVGHVPVAPDRGQRSQPTPLRPRLRGEHERGRAVVHTGRISRRRGAVGDEDGLERGQALERRVAARALVGVDHRRALPALDRHGRDLLGEPAAVDGRDGTLVRAERPGVLLLARDADLGGHDRVLLGHDEPVEGAGQPVVGHRVEHRAVTHAVAEPALRQKVRRVRHRLHSPGQDDVVLARPDHDVGQRRGPHARCAHLVDRLRSDRRTEPDPDRHLPRGDLTGAGLEYLAHDDVADVPRRDAGALERGRRSVRPELRPGEAREAAAEPGKRRSGGAQNDGSCLTHGQPCSIVKPVQTTFGQWWWRRERGAAR